MTASTYRNGFRYYHPQTVSPSNERIFEMVTWSLLLVLFLIFAPLLLYLKKRQSSKQHVMFEAGEGQDVYCAMNYAPFMDRTDTSPRKSDECEGSGRPKRSGPQSPTGNSCSTSRRGVSLLSRLRIRLKKKSLNNKNDPNPDILVSLKNGEKKVAQQKGTGASASTAILNNPERKSSEENVGTYDSPLEPSFSTIQARTNRLVDDENDPEAQNPSTKAIESMSSFIDGSTRLFGDLFGTKDFDERAREVRKIVSHNSEDDGIDTIEIHQASIFQVNPYGWRNSLHGTSGPYLYERSLLSDQSYKLDTTDDDSYEFLSGGSTFQDYGSFIWDDLPSDVKLASETLGIDQAMWDAQVKSDLFKKYWDELTVFQQAACVELGFNKATWETRFDTDDFKLPTYEGYSWKELPPNALLAAETLGYSQQMWDNNQDTEFCKKKWRELTKQQQGASLALLGFDQMTWDSNWLNEKVQRNENTHITYEDYDWNDLPPNARHAALTLGYSKELWDLEQDTETCTKKWKKLSQDQQAAAFLLYGFDQRRWDNQLQFQAPSLLNTYGWQQLPPDAQEAAHVLGYTKATWDMNERPSLSFFEWDGMTQTERAAWFQLIIAIRAKKERARVLESHKDILEKHCNHGENTQESMSHPLADDQSLLSMMLPAFFANVGKPLLQALITAIILSNMGTYIFLTWMMVNLLLSLGEHMSAGVVEAENFLCRQAVAMKKFFLAAQFVQLSMVSSAMLVIPFYIVTISLSENFLAGLGYGEIVADYATTYAPLAALSRLVQGSVAGGLNRLMWSDGRGCTMIKLDFGANAVQLLIMVVAMIGFNCASMEGLALIELGIALLHTALIFNYSERFGWLEKYDKGLLGYWSLGNKTLVKEFLKMSVPLHIGHMLSCGDWQLWTWFAVAMGPAEAVAWTVMQALRAVLDAFPTAITNATEIQIGVLIGNGRTESAKQIAQKSLFYLLGTSVLTAVAFLFLGGNVIRIFANDQVLSPMINQLVPLVCIGTVVKAVGSHTHMILESIGRAKTGVVIFYAGTYLISLPIAILLVFGAKFGLESLMMACVLGYSLIAFTNLLAVFSTDWTKMSRKVLVKAGKNHKVLVEMTTV